MALLALISCQDRDGSIMARGHTADFKCSELLRSPAMTTRNEYSHSMQYAICTCCNRARHIQHDRRTVLRGDSCAMNESLRSTLTNSDVDKRLAPSMTTSVCDSFMFLATLELFGLFLRLWRARLFISFCSAFRAPRCWSSPMSCQLHYFCAHQ